KGGGQVAQAAPTRDRDRHVRPGRAAGTAVDLPASPPLRAPGRRPGDLAGASGRRQRARRPDQSPGRLVPQRLLAISANPRLPPDGPEQETVVYGRDRPVHDGEGRTPWGEQAEPDERAGNDQDGQADPAPRAEAERTTFPPRV